MQDAAAGDDEEEVEEGLEEDEVGPARRGEPQDGGPARLVHRRRGRRVGEAWVPVHELPLEILESVGASDRSILQARRHPELGTTTLHNPHRLKDGP